MANREIVLTVKTGDQPDAGTTAKVFFQLVGENLTSQWFDFEAPRDAYSSGRTTILRKTFREDGNERFPSLGYIRGINVFHDNFGDHSSWFLEFVEVDGWRFNFNTWLSQDRQPNRTYASSRELTTNYRVSFRGPAFIPLLTRRRPQFPSTTSKLFAQIIGERGATPWVELLRPRQEIGGGIPLVPSTIFEFNYLDVGNVEKIWIRHDNSGTNPDFSFDSIEVQRRLTVFIRIPLIGRIRLTLPFTSLFDEARTLSRRQGDGRIDAVLVRVPWLQDQRPINVRLVTFTELLQESTASFAGDLDNLNTIYNRFGIRFNPLDTPLVLGDLPDFDERRRAGEEWQNVIERLMRERNEIPSRTSYMPLVYVPDAAFRNNGYGSLGRWVALNLRGHSNLTLGQEAGHFFNLSHTAVGNFRNPSDVIEQDPFMIMSPGARLPSPSPLLDVRLTDGHIKKFVRQLEVYRRDRGF